MELKDVLTHEKTISSEFRLSINQKPGCTNLKKKYYITIQCEDCKETVTKIFEKKSWGFKCGKCSRGRKSTDTFIKEAILKWKDKYTYDRSKYENNATKLIVTCPIHGDWPTRPTDFLKGTGCPVCAARSRTQAIPLHLQTVECTLYWVHFPHLGMYKIGVTTQPLEKRFTKEQPYTVEWTTSLPYKEAVQYESSIKKTYIKERYQGKELLLEGGGSYELFLTNFIPSFNTLKELINETT